MPTRHRTAVVVIATGKEFRLAASELAADADLAPSSLLGQTLDHALASELPITVVTTRDLAALSSTRVAARDVVLVSDADAVRGPGLSIAAGVAAKPNAAGWIVLPASMAAVRASTLKALAQALAQHPVAYAQYRGLRGQLVGYSAGLYSELVSLDNEGGPRRLQARYPAVGVEVDDPGILSGTVASDLPALRLAPTVNASGQPVS